MAKRIKWEKHAAQIKELEATGMHPDNIAKEIGVDRASLQYYIKTGRYTSQKEEGGRKKPYDEEIITEDIYAWRLGYELGSG